MQVRFLHGAQLLSGLMVVTLLSESRDLGSSPSIATNGMENEILEHARKESRDENGRRISNKQLRADLMEKDPRCHWCHIMLDNSPEAHRSWWGKGERPPDNAATIEHLFDKFDIRRYKYHKNEFKVLACYKCNTTRGNLHCRSIPKEEMNKRKTVLLDRRQRGDTTPRALILLRAGFYA